MWVLFYFQQLNPVWIHKVELLLSLSPKEINSSLHFTDTRPVQKVGWLTADNVSAVALVASCVVWRLLNTMQFPSQGLKSVCVAEMLIHVVSTKRFTPAQVQLSADSIGHTAHTSLKSSKQSCHQRCSVSCVCVCGLPWGCRLRLSSSFVYSFVSKASESYQLVKRDIRCTDTL